MDEPPKDIHHDPWLLALSPALVELVDAIFVKTERARAGSRKPRRDAVERRRAVLGNLIANLAVLASSHPPGSRLAISLKNNALTRYDRKEFPREVIKQMVDRMEDLGLVERFMGLRGRERTAITPAQGLISRLPQIRPGDIGRAPGAEPILLRVSHGTRKPKGLLDYADNAESIAMRTDLETINQGLAKADIRLAGVHREDCQLVRIFQVEAGEAPHFQHYGRMYRAFWVNLAKTQRHLITINGEPVVDLDYRAMHIALAYHLQGATMLDGDPYRIPGLGGHRDGVKKAVSALLSKAGPIRQLSAELRALLPDGWTGRQLTEAIREAHPVIAPLLGTAIAPILTRTESDLMVAVLLRLFAHGIVALPCHDGLLVGESFKADAIAAMSEVSVEMLGRELTVEEKPVWRP